MTVIFMTVPLLIFRSHLVTGLRGPSAPLLLVDRDVVEHPGAVVRGLLAGRGVLDDRDFHDCPSLDFSKSPDNRVARPVGAVTSCRPGRRRASRGSSSRASWPWWLS